MFSSVIAFIGRETGQVLRSAVAVVRTFVEQAFQWVCMLWLAVRPVLVELIATVIVSLIGVIGRAQA